MTGSPETFESIWSYCSANKRVIPRVQEWIGLYEMLADSRQKPSGGWEPSLPLILAAWHETIPIEKQLRFREHVQWAADYNQLEQIGAYLRASPEEQWFHFGEL